MRTEKSITIQASPQDVFAYVADLTKHSEWASQPMEIKQEGSGPVGVGTKYAHTGKQLGTHHDEVTIIEYSSPSRVAWESKGDAGEAKHWFQLKGQDGTTELSKGLEFEKTSTSTKLATPLLVFLLPAALNKDLRKIKTKLEG